jgi:hypothetical protein
MPVAAFPAGKTVFSQHGEDDCLADANADSIKSWFNSPWRHGRLVSNVFP